MSEEFEFKSATKMSEANLQLELVKIPSGSHVCSADALKEKGFVDFIDEAGRQRFSKNGENFKYNHPIWDIKGSKILLRKLN